MEGLLSAVAGRIFGITSGHAKKVILESFRFRDENDDEWEILEILS